MYNNDYTREMKDQHSNKVVFGRTNLMRNNFTQVRYSKTATFASQFSETHHFL